MTKIIPPPTPQPVEPPKSAMEQQLLFAVDSESMTVGDTTVDRVSQMLHRGVSLSTVLLLLVGAFTLYRAYHCWSSRRSGQYIKLEERTHANYHSI